MIKAILLIFCGFILYSVDAANLISALLSSDGTRPTRVRTVEEIKTNNDSQFTILDFIGLIEQYEGYTAEEYKVTTDDGYILGLHRITGSPQSPKSDNKPVVYIAHGLFGSSDFMVDLGPNKSIAFELADAGYDVWLGNVRGNSHSRAHVKLSPDNKDFWKFSMDEHALYDTSKFIDFALEKTGQAKLTYIGYSMGTALSYMLLAGKPEYNEKINLLINLAPAVYFLNPVNMKMMYSLVIPILTNAEWRDLREVLPHNGEIASVGQNFCSSEVMNMCGAFLSTFVNIDKMNLSSIPTILTYAPAGSSYYTVKHYNQLIRANGKLSMYDYGCSLFKIFSGCPNQDHYNSTVPPEYDVSKVTVPNVILYGENDIFVKVQEAEYLKSKLSNVVVFEKIADKKFNHLDFIWSTDAKPLVFDRVLSIMSDQLK